VYKRLLIAASSIASIMVLCPISAAVAESEAIHIRDVPQPNQAKDLLPSSPPALLAQEVVGQSAPSDSAKLPPPEPAKPGFYVSVSGDARFIRKATLDPINSSLSFSPGFGINTAVGYRFKNNLRLEGEFSYGSNDVDEAQLPDIPATTTTQTQNVPLTLATPITTPFPIPIPGVGTIPAGTLVPAGFVFNPGPPLTNATTTTIGPFTIPAGTDLSVVAGLLPLTGGGTTTTTVVLTPAIPAAKVKVSGRVTTLSGLLNVYYDFPTGSRFVPYIGGGVGVTRASAENLSATYPGTPFSVKISGSAAAFVYQLRAGFAYHFDAKTALTFGYRYFNVAKQSFDLDPVGEVDVDGLDVHNIEVGLRYRF
jgi:opacity protein-like surface antigen